MHVLRVHDCTQTLVVSLFVCFFTVCGIIYFVKTRVIPALERTYTDFDCLRSIRTADKTKRDSTHIDSGPDDSLPTTENDDFVSVNHIADIQNLSDDTKIELARYVLRKCYESIITYMDANTVCIRLFQNGFLTFGQKQFIDGYQFKRDKNIYIYDRLYANSSAGNYDMFKDILLETKDTELIKNLEQEEYTFLSTLLGQQQIHDPSPTTTTVIANIHQLNETAPGQQQRHDSSPRTSTTQADIQQLNQIEPGQQHRHDPSPTTNTAIADIHQLNETEPGRQQIYDPSSRTTTALADIRQLSETEPGVEDPLLGQTDESAV